MDLLLKRRRIIASQRGEDTTDYTLLPLTFKCLTGGNLSIKNANGSYDRNFEYSLNGGAWTAFDLPKNTASKLIATLSPNDTISFRRDNDNFADTQFISDSNLTFDIYGNLLSLQYGSAFNGQTELRNTSKTAFGATFSGTNVVDASKLMLTSSIVSNGCYKSMFENCVLLQFLPKLFTSSTAESCYENMFKNTGITTIPDGFFDTITGAAHKFCASMFKNCNYLVTVPNNLLSKIQLSTSCYEGMFNGCISLRNAPSLPATNLTTNCYLFMFYGCESLVVAPELPATILQNRCYESMFEGCTNLVNAPELPATTLAQSCYKNMFKDCTSLTTAPELLATTLVAQCYYSMFANCNNLNYLRCLATDISANNCTTDMLNPVAQQGTFVKASGVNWPSGRYGIPNGWTVIEE